MSHPFDELGDEDLILYHYGEAADAEAIAALLASSPEARKRYEELRRVLDAAGEWGPPELPESYGADLWQRLRPRLRQSRVLPAAGRFGATPRRWLPAAAAAAALLTVGYLAGRLGHQVTAPGPAQAFTAEARQRILAETLAEHLERSQRLFTELDNTAAGEGAALASDQARDLLSANRLYRTAAERGGRDGVAALLADIEPVLVELAHLPAEPDAAALDHLRQRIESNGLLFKTRVASDLLTRSLDVKPKHATI